MFGARTGVFIPPPPPPSSGGGSENKNSWLMAPNRLKMGSSIKSAKSTCRPREMVDSLAGDSVTHRAMRRATNSLNFINEAKRARAIKYVDPSEVKVVDETRPAKISSKKCKATTMSSKPCPFRATYGDFCKHHKIEK